MRESQGIRGRVRLILRDAESGEALEERTAHNAVMTGGSALVARLFCGESTKHVTAVGVGESDLNPGDGNLDDLDAPITGRAGISNVAVSADESTHSATVTFSRVNGTRRVTVCVGGIPDGGRGLAGRGCGWRSSESSSISREVYLSEQRCCDFCGRSEIELSAQILDGSQVMESDEDGLWVCHSCRAKLVLPTVGKEAGELAEELHALVGESAGAICRTLNLPYEPPYQSVIDAASKIAYDEDRFMSAWSFVTQWFDGTTIWRAEDGESEAVVAPDGSVRVRSSYSS